MNREDKILIGKDLVPNAIEEYLADKTVNYEYYWSRTEYMDFTNDNDYIQLAELYLRLRGQGKDLSDIGKRLYKKAEKLKVPGTDRTYYQQDN